MENDVIKQQVQEFFDQDRRKRPFVIFLRESDFAKKFPERVKQFSPVEVDDNIKNKISKGATIVARTGLAIFTYGLSEAAILGGKGAKQGYEKLKRSLNKIDADILYLSEMHLDAALTMGTLRKPEGGFAYNVVYTAHPYLKEVYAPFARFHDILFKEKQSEIVNICSALGASKLKVVYERVQVKASSQKFGINLPDFLGSAKTDNQNSQTRSQEISHDATYKPKRKPTLPPENQLVWYHHEPQWQQLVTNRLEDGLLSIKLQISSYEDHYVTHELALGFEQAGLDLGGKWIEHTQTMLLVEGEFVPLDELPQ